MCRIIPSDVVLGTTSEYLGLFRKDVHMGPKQSAVQFKNKERNESYPGANRIEIMMVTTVWPSGDSQGHCSNK